MNTTVSSERSQKIAALNDQFRTTFVGGLVLVTAGVQMLGRDSVSEALAAVRTFDSFGEDNDPYGEHDFGSFTIEGITLFWKIDLYEEPFVKSVDEDPVVTRVLTIGLAHDY